MSISSFSYSSDFLHILTPRQQKAGDPIRQKLTAVLLAFCLVLVCSALEYWNPDTRAVLAPAGNSVSIPVIMYHHILESSARLGDYVISPEQFESDLRYLCDHGYQTVTPDQLLDFVENGTPLPEKCVLITFDDGYESTYAYAFPLLQKYNMTAVISIIGIHTERFSDPNEPRHINYSHVSWDQLREMTESGVFTVGNHTTNLHNDGTNGSRKGIVIRSGEEESDYCEAVAGDLAALNRRIEEELGAAPAVFAYPFGALCKESKPILSELGFSIILTCEEKVSTVTQGQTLPVTLCRFNRAHRYSDAAFFKKLGIS